MVITYKIVNEEFKLLYDKWDGVKYGICYAFRINDKICITYHGKPILWINKKNQYQYVAIDNETIRQFYNQYTPITIKKRKTGWYVGRMPYHINMRVDIRGDFLIPEVWPPPNYTKHCKECNITYTDNLCESCYENYTDGEGRW